MCHARVHPWLAVPRALEHVGIPVPPIPPPALSTNTHTTTTITEGFLVWLFSPIVVFTAIDQFNGWGGFVFVGLGAAVLGFSPTYQVYFITDEGRDYWIMVRAESGNEGRSGGSIGWIEPLPPFTFPHDCPNDPPRQQATKTTQTK